MSIDKNCRHRGSDERNSPLLRDGDEEPADGEVVIGGEESDQTEDEATDGLGQTKAVEPEPVEAKPKEGRLVERR
ncbi:MAG: hypothetical protein ACK59A_06670 [Cyanobacteriota bacterium]